ncbi:MAG: hypothetical protein ACKVI4_13635 [Actinomycetales bacterium]
MSPSPLQHDRSMPVPSPGSAMYMMPFWQGYMNANSVGFVREAAEVVPTLHADTMELTDAVLQPRCADDSLCPRRVSMWLLVKGIATASPAGRAYVDAFSEMAASVISKMKMTIVAGPDAQFVLDRLRKEESTGPAQVMKCPFGEDVVLVVRWASPRKDEPGTVTMRAEVHRLHEAAQSKRFQTLHGVCMNNVAQAAMRSLHRNALPWKDELAACKVNIGQDAFFVTTVRAAEQFFSVMDGGRVMTLSPYTTSSEFAGKRLEDSGVFVRMVQKREGVNKMHASCFHAFILCSPDKVVDVMAWASGIGDAPLPLLDQVESADWAMHLCGRWMEPRSLGASLSLYSASGRCGAPITAYGNVVQRHTTVVCPLDARMYQAYDMFPCCKESVLPSDERLMRPFRALMAPVFESLDALSKKFDALHRNQQIVSMYGPSFQNTELSDTASVDTSSSSFPLRVFDSEKNSAEMHAETYLLDAFGLDFASRRVTVGEAYKRLSSRGAPADLTNVLMEACMNIGSMASLQEAFQHAERCMQGARKREYVSLCTEDDHAQKMMRREQERLRRVADASLKMNVRCEGSRPLPPPAQVDPRQVKHLLSAVGLKKGMDARVQVTNGALCEADADRMMKLLSQALRSEMDVQAHDHAKEILQCPQLCMERKGGSMTTTSALRGLVATASHILGNEMTPQPEPFLISQLPREMSSDSAIVFERITTSGNLLPATPGELMNESMNGTCPHVLFANYADEVPMKLTATIPMSEVLQ